MFASATRDDATQEIIVKVVNSAPEPLDTTIEVKGAPQAREAKAVVLASGDAMDENSLDEPEKVSPKPVAVQVQAGRIRHSFPGNSFTVIRIQP